MPDEVTRGYHSRSGSKHRPWFEGVRCHCIAECLKKGLKIFSLEKEYQLVNLSDLNLMNLDKINPTVLKDNGLVKYSLRPIKVLGDGEIDKKIHVIASAFSASAKDKIEKAGGTAEVQ